MLTAFEVFEHLVNPLPEIERMLEFSPNILFTTLLPPSRLKNAKEWWYLALEHGQHVSIYSVKSLNYIAKKFGLHLSTDGSSTHLLSQKPFSNAAAVVRQIRRRKLHNQSLLMQDFRAVTGWNV